MKPVNDIESLNEIIKNYFLKKTITNNYLLPESYAQYIDTKKLFFFTTNSNVCFLLEKPEFYQLYYYINNQNELLTFVADKPVVMEILYRGEAQRPNEIMDYWEKCGFRQHIRREHMFAHYNQINFFDENDSVKVKYAETDQEIKFSQNIIEQTFDKYTGDILSLTEVKTLARNKNILCASVEDNLCGVIKYEIKNGIVMWGHFAIKVEHRGKGIATKLMQTFFRLNGTKENTRFQMWVVIDNFKAKSIYERIGFTFDNKISQSMLMEK